MSIPLCRPAVGDEERTALAEVLSSGQLVQGPRVQAFEEALSEQLGGRGVVAVGNGTSALHLALLALGIGPGDEVILGDLSWPSPANMVAQVGAQPMFVDVCPESGNLNPENIASVLSPRTRAVILVHSFGIPADLKGIRRALEERPDVAVVEDAACALGAWTSEGRVGALADLACFSFHPRKIITTGEGGAVVAKHPEMEARLRRLCNHGMDLEKQGEERFAETGYNLRMSDLHAAIGLVQMDRLDFLVAERRRLHGIYQELFTGLDGATLLSGLADTGTVVQSLIAVLDDGVDRDAMVVSLRSCGIEATLASYANHRLPPFRGQKGAESERLSISARMASQGLTLPLYPGMEEDAPVRVVEALRTSLKEQGQAS